MPNAPLTLRRWSRDEYDRLVDLGAFERDPVELIGGNLIVAEPQSSHHAATIGAAHELFTRALPAGWIVRGQLPLALDEESAPEPDLAVVAGAHADYLGRHPGRPALVVEVAESSLAFDRRDKASIYARAGIEDYWIVNLVDRVLEIHRRPLPDAGAPYGWRYASVARVSAGAVVTPLALPSLQIAVEAMIGHDRP
jgi:Uma2 family endonuclease